MCALSLKTDLVHPAHLPLLTEVEIGSTLAAAGRCFPADANYLPSSYGCTMSLSWADNMLKLGSDLQPLRAKSTTTTGRHELTGDAIKPTIRKDHPACTQLCKS